MTMVIAIGEKVRLVSVDKYGFNGRDFHPTTKDVGFVGVVVQNELVEPHTDEEAAEGILIAYRVCRPDDGKVLDLMSHEVEVVATRV